MKNNRALVHYTPFLKNTAVHLTPLLKEDRYKAIVENSVHAFFLTGSEGIILEVNHAAMTMFGYSHEEFKFLKKWRFLDFNDSRLTMALQQCEKTGFAITETTGARKTGEFFPIEISFSSFTDSNGESMTSMMISDISTRKRAEAAMRLSNERFDLVVKATNELIWDWDLVSGEIYRTGSSLMDVYGHTSNELIKNFDSWADHLHPDDKDHIEQKIAHYINSNDETAFNFEYRFRGEDGVYAYISDKGYIIRDEEGKVTRMIGAAEDITERKKTAMAIEESEQRYKMFVQQSTEGIWRIELKEGIQINTPTDAMINYCYNNAFVAECNDNFAKLYGFEKAADIIGIPLNKILPGDNPLYMGYIAKFCRNGFRIQEELSYQSDAEGNELVFLNNMIGIIEGGYLKRAWGTQRNITEHKKAERQLLASEVKYRELFNNNPSCIFIWEPDTLRITEVNQAAINIYGYTREEFLQLTVLDIRPGSEHAKFLEVVRSVMQNGNYKKTNVWRHINKKGEHIFMEVSSHNMVYNGRRALLAIGNNITDRILLENSLNEEREIRQQQITEAVIQGQEKERTGLGEELHDNINQILASTKLYIECALKDRHPRKDLMIESKLLVEKAMAEIRTLSKSLLPPSLGEIGLFQALYELSENIKQVNDLSITIRCDGIDENELPNKLKLTIFRIVQEQLNNVIKHAGASNVLISVSKEAELIRVIIKDDGQGFDTTAKRNGVGLRNIISRADVNHGVVIIDSLPGKGCELIVNFSSGNMPHAAA